MVGHAGAVLRFWEPRGACFTFTPENPEVKRPHAHIPSIKRIETEERPSVYRLCSTWSRWMAINLEALIARPGSVTWFEVPSAH